MFSRIHITPANRIGKSGAREREITRNDNGKLSDPNIPRPVLDGLGEMARPDVLHASQVGDGAGQLEQAVVGARRKLELAHGRFHQRARGIVQDAEFAHFRRAHICIAADISSLEAPPLALAGRFHPETNGFRRFPKSLVAQLLILYPGDFDVDVDAVQQRAGDTLLVLGDRAGGAGTLLDRIPIIAAGAGVHGSHQLEIGGESQRALRPADGDDLVLDGLAHHFQDTRAELGQLVQEEHAAVRQGNLAGMRPVAPAHQPGMRDGVVWGAEGAVLDEGGVRRELVGDRIDAGHVQGFLDAHARQDTGHGACQQGLAGSGWTDHQDIVRPCRGDFQGALDVLLAFDLAEIGLNADGQVFRGKRRLGLDGMGALQVAVKGCHRGDRDHIQVWG